MIISEITCRTIVNRTGGFLAAFTHTINPYHGCAFGRMLCGLPDYAPEIVRAYGEKRQWGTYLDVKVNAPAAYDRDYDRIRAGAKPALRIFMSSVTDPYVPQERRWRVTRGILERMIERPPDLLILQTHTPNPLWDIDLIEDLSRRFPLAVQVSVETDRERMGPPFPPHAYPIAGRLDALAALKARGIETVGVVAPLWPIDNAEAFAHRLDEGCAFVVVDHYLVGDGSRDGSRTRKRLTAAGKAFPDLLIEAGFEEWTRLEALDHVVEVFRGVLGPARVGVSCEGFQQAAHRLPKGGNILMMRP